MIGFAVRALLTAGKFALRNPTTTVVTGAAVNHVTDGAVGKVVAGGADLSLSALEAVTSKETAVSVVSGVGSFAAAATQGGADILKQVGGVAIDHAGAMAPQVTQDLKNAAMWVAPTSAKIVAHAKDVVKGPGTDIKAAPLTDAFAIYNTTAPANDVAPAPEGKKSLRNAWDTAQDAMNLNSIVALMAMFINLLLPKGQEIDPTRIMAALAPKPDQDEPKRQAPQVAMQGPAPTMG